MRNRRSIKARAGLALILIPFAWVSFWVCWHLTRSWEPLSIPLTLSAGHQRAEFSTNVESVYAIEIDIDWPSDFCCKPLNASLLTASWQLWKGEQAISRGTPSPQEGIGVASRVLGSFAAAKGHYVLDLDIPKDESSFRAYHPRLVIYGNAGKSGLNGDQGGLALLTLLVGSSFAAPLLFIWREERRVALAVAHPLTQRGPAPRIFRTLPGSKQTVGALRRPKRRTLATPLSKLSTASLIIVLALLLVWIPLVVATPMERLSTGLRIGFLRGAKMAPAGPGLQPVLVRVMGDERQYSISLNYESVALADLPALLQRELNRRPPEWPVYLEGDPNLDIRSIAEVIDAIEGQGGQVVLLTKRSSRASNN